MRKWKKPLQRSFYRSINAIFGKIGTLASEEVTMELAKSVALRPRMLLLNYSGCQIARLHCNAFPNETVQISECEYH